MLGLAGNNKAQHNLGRIRELIANILVESWRFHIGHCEIGIAFPHRVIEEVDAAKVVKGDEGVACGHYVLPALGIDGQEVGQQQALFIDFVVEFEHFLKLGRRRAKRPLAGVVIVAEVTVVSTVDIVSAPGGRKHTHLAHRSCKGAECQRVAIRVGFLELDKHIVELVLVGGNFQAQLLKDVGAVEPAAALGFFNTLLRELVEATVR